MNTLVGVLIIAMVMFFVVIFLAGTLMVSKAGDDSGNESSPRIDGVGVDTRDTSPFKES